MLYSNIPWRIYYSDDNIVNIYLIIEWYLFGFAAFRFHRHIAHLFLRDLPCMMTSSNGIFSALLAICAGNSQVTGDFPAQRPVTRSFDIIFDLHLIKRLSRELVIEDAIAPIMTSFLSLWRLC